MSFRICKLSTKLLLVAFSILVITPIAMSKYEEKNNIQVSEGWGVTDVKISKMKYTWSINNLSFCCPNPGNSLKSPTFSSNDECKWFLDIFPKGLNEENKAYTGLFLNSVNCNQSIMAEISIVNDLGEKTNIKTFTHEYQRGKGYGFTKYILQTDLSQKANELLLNDKMTIICEFTAQVGTENSSRQFSQPKHHLVKDFGHLLDHHDLADVTLISEEKEFKAHKAILAIRSPVFKAMFEGNAERKNNDVVQITDVDSKTLAEMLRFIYTEQVFDLENFAPTLLAAAKNYKLEGLKTLCENNLRENLDAESAIDSFILGDKYDAYELKNDAKKFITSHLSELANTTEFKSLIFTQPRLAVETFN